MSGTVTAWQQAGRLHVWRYATPGRSRRGWHFHADPAGCASIVDLVVRMTAGAVRCHRTLQLGAVTPAVWGLPSLGPPKGDRFAKLRIEYSPDEAALRLEEADDRLVLRIGEKRAAALSAAFTELMVGLNDFGIATSDDKRAETWMFW